jgi:hypothetical protein
MELVEKKSKTKEKVENKITYSKILNLNLWIAGLKNKGLSVASLTNLAKLKKETKELVLEFSELQKTLFEEKYKLEAKDNSYNYLGHPKEKQIEADYAELLEQPCAVKSTLNFITWKEFSSMTSDLDLDFITELAEWLVEKK